MNKLISLLLSMMFTIALTSSAYAAGGMAKGPNVAAPDRYVYYPGTEVLAKDEVRVIACGTGMPDARCEQLRQQIDDLRGKPQRRKAASDRYRIECLNKR